MSIDHEIKCTTCGKQFKIPKNPKPNDIITCIGCGDTGRYSDIKSSAINQAKKLIEKQLGDDIKNIGLD